MPKRGGVTLSKKDFMTLTKTLLSLQEEVRNLKAAGTANAVRTDWVPEIENLDSLSPDQREAALKDLFEKMTPAEKLAREQAIRAAYAKLPPAPVADQSHRPGSYVASGSDASGVPIKQKVRYTRPFIEHGPHEGQEDCRLGLHLPQIKFTPLETLRGGASYQGIHYDVNRGQEITVPSPIKEQYDAYFAALARVEWQTQPITQQEEERVKFLLAKGEKRVWTRVHQVGVGIMPQEVFPQQAPAVLE